ncbi:MAG: L,D-transpeptidase [Bryobacteraceae bacterium]|nr:L,D-transpeptidase [Bryobacteraceae bacterium]
MRHLTFLLVFSTLLLSAPPKKTGPRARKATDERLLRAQVLLDRAHLSPGEIDGSWGDNTRTALQGFQSTRQLPITGQLDDATWNALNQDQTPELTNYTITKEDAGGPFEKVPEDMVKKAKLERLAYETLVESLAERFHSSPGLLKKLNPKTKFAEGEEIRVPNVHTEAPAGRAVRIIVDKSDSVLIAYDEKGQFLAQYPATMGSEHDPLPIGTWTVLAVVKNPTFHYNPGLFWDADPSHSKAKIAPGPNNPVGVVWIDLSKEHYGIHGTPEPSTIAKTQSHGCIRLTNWDAMELASLVMSGTEAVLQE